MTSLQERTHVDAAGASSVLVVDPNLDSRLDAVTAVKQAGLPLAGEAPYGAEATFLEADRAPALILVALEEPPMRGIATIEATVEAGVATADLGGLASTAEFTETVVARTLRR